MNTTLALKVIGDRWKGTLYYIGGICAYMLMIAAIFPTFRKMKGIEEIFAQYPKEFLRLFGATEIDLDNFNNYVTMEFLGLIAVIIISAYVFTFVRSIVSGELKEGTLELLLSQPVDRTRVIITKSAVMLGGVTLLVLSIAVSAFAFGTAFKVGVSYRGFLAYVPLGVALFSCIGGYSLLLTLLSPRRGVMTAIGVTFVFYMMNFAAQVSEPVEKLKYLSIFNYYNPAGVLNSGTVPVRDVIILFGAGLLFFALSLPAFDRMDVAPA